MTNVNQIHYMLLLNLTLCLLDYFAYLFTGSILTLIEDVHVHLTLYGITRC